MKKFVVVLCSIFLAFGLTGCIGKGKAPVGKGKASRPNKGLNFRPV